MDELAIERIPSLLQPTCPSLPSLSSSPSLSFTTTSSVAVATPVLRPLSDAPSRMSKPRESSETAIFSIYSMYGDGPLARNSWMPGASNNADPNAAKASPKGSPIPQVSLTLPDHFPNGFRSSLLDEADSELAYLDRPESYPQQSPSNRLAPALQLNDSTAPTVVNAKTNGNSSIQHRPSSSKSTARSSVAGNRQSASAYHSAESSFSSQSHSGGQQQHSSSQRHSPTSLRQATLPPPVTPDRLSPHMGLPATNSTAILSTYSDSPPSKASLMPSEGEDLDAFHVRNTYAMLEHSGVKGDGYEEGVERTRARIGPSRSSQLNALGAVGDGSERTKELDEREVELLSSVDRYGFFSTPSHDRLILLTASPLSKRLSLTKTAGPASAPTSAKSLNALPATQTPVKEEERIAKWTRMLQPDRHDLGHNIEAWIIRPPKEPKFRRRVYKGIPDRWRRAAWDLMLSRFAKTNPAEMSALANDYQESLDRPSTYDIQIDLDVPRTVSGHIMFRTRYGAGQRSLFHVLHSFSLRCEECGYVQGMGPIAATLLCYFDPERTYAAIVRLHDAYSMHDIFSPGFPGLLEAIYVQERLTEQMMPEVYSAFKKHMISTTSYATKWYITLFANSVPFQTQLRLWDAFLLEGPDLFVAVAVAIVWVYRDQITATAANFETVLSLLSSFFVPEDEDMLLHWIERTLGDKKIRSSMQSWRKDWHALVAAGKEGDALL